MANATQKTYSMSITINFNITDEDIDDIMCAAVEGGINYWCEEIYIIGEKLGEFSHEQISRGGTLKFKVNEGFEQNGNGKWIRWYTLDTNRLLHGLSEYTKEHPEIINDGVIDTYNIDAEGADCILQFALFDNIVFG